MLPWEWKNVEQLNTWTAFLTKWLHFEGRILLDYLDLAASQFFKCEESSLTKKCYRLTNHLANSNRFHTSCHTVDVIKAASQIKMTDRPFEWVLQIDELVDVVMSGTFHLSNLSARFASIACIICIKLLKWRMKVVETLRGHTMCMWACPPASCPRFFSLRSERNATNLKWSQQSIHTLPSRTPWCPSGTRGDLSIRSKFWLYETACRKNKNISYMSYILCICVCVCVYDMYTNTYTYYMSTRVCVLCSNLYSLVITLLILCYTRLFESFRCLSPVPSSSWSPT